MYIDGLPGGALVVSTLKDARLFRVDPRMMEAMVFVDGLPVRR
jgi:hypothetical protein